MPAYQLLKMVVDEVALLVQQRQDPTLRAELGDADALAEACYAPIIEFARTRGLALTCSGRDRAGDFDLGIWTGFIPTPIAPIFLPTDFFARAAWWPAIAHEIGHDFLASSPGWWCACAASCACRTRAWAAPAPRDRGGRRA